MNPAVLVEAFKRFQRQYGIVGVAFGPKAVAGKTDGNPDAVTFFVNEKVAVKGARRRLSDGRRVLPKAVELQGETIQTDVVAAASEQPLAGRTRSPPQIYRAGGKISNRELTGTIGCLVKIDGRPGVFAVTNEHIALGQGTDIAFPDFRADFAYIGQTTASVTLVADEKFLPVFDHPESYIDVDCGLVRVPPKFEDRFSPEIPNYGRPRHIFVPDASSANAYVQSLLRRSVFSYSWRSGPRRGVISHVYYVYQRPPVGMIQVSCFLVQSLDAQSPGINGDSGKLWMTQVGGENFAVGIHSGVVPVPSLPGRFAMVTEFASLARHLNIALV